MPMRNVLMVAALGGAAWWLMRPKAAPEPEAEPMPESGDWFDWSSWNAYWDESGNAGGGEWITNTYQDAAAWLSDAWDNLTE